MTNRPIDRATRRSAARRAGCPDAAAPTVGFTWIALLAVPLRS
jgi:hypothetical protein